MARRLTLLLALLLLASLPGRSQESVPRLSVSYAVDASTPESGRIRVVMTVRNNVEPSVDVSIPAWAPGAYRIVKYSKQVSNLEASKDAEKLEVAPVDDQTWTVKTRGASRFSVTYDLAVDRGRMDKDHCFVAGPDTYLYLTQHKEAPCSVGFTLPDGWKVGTGLDADGPLYRARDYDTFIDCPTELGRFELFTFQADGSTYELVIHAKGPVDGEKLTQMCRTIVVEQNKVFGAPPFKRYVFLYHFKDAVGGRGLEHLNSTDIIMPYTAIRTDPMLAASVTSHEYFHLWNVKRIRPLELGPFDYTRIVRSKALWLCEGVTSYFGDRGLARSGIWKDQQYLDHLGAEIETLQNNPDRKVTAIEKASESVWDRKDWPRVDYYNKGELLGLLIDLKIRIASRGRKSIDDVMRHLYKKYVVDPSAGGTSPIGVGYPENGILQALNEVTGEDWSSFYKSYISGVEELPFVEILEAAGLAPALQVVDTPDLGADLRGTSILFVVSGGVAERAGIRQGDRIVGINGVEVNRTTLREELSKLTPGDDARLTILRMDERSDVTLKPTVRQRATCKVRRSESPSDLQKRVLDAWLGKSRDF
ncbi:MAG TPA: PDZ domain-containing protein [Planctomycetota bacterium]|nr:PDZ domain-containing protein [Planctomycetota bacterium]